MRSMFIAALLLSTPAAAQDLTPAETAKIDAVVGEALAKSGVPSASIAVVRGGRVVLAKAYGKASEAIPVARPDLPYQIASISKQFTAAAILLLEDQGKLRLDDKVAKYVPGVTGGDTITIRQLLDHTSGLQDYWPQDYSFAAMAKPTTPQGIVDRWAKKPLDFAPGTQYQYSNTAYVVAGLIVEKVSGEPLIAFLQKRIFTPLGMTSVIDQDKAIGARFPQGYKRFALGPVRVETPAADGWLYAAGELSMTATDLARWNIARMNRATLSADDWTAQETTTKLNDGSDTGYGLGVSVGQFDGRRMVEHSGESVGFLSENMVFPDQKTSVTVLTNSWFSNAYRVMAQGIARTVLPPAAATGTEAIFAIKARKVFDQLRAGTLDRALLTTDANYYFDATAQADYKSSLSALGEPTAFAPVGQPRLRGGYVARAYRVTYGDRALSISTFAEPGDAGRFEQFLVAPIQ
ncbi:beta-lactamase family protein [Sphingomonas donggukensis]|uniref:Beta-lactamase family protein n=1 Tax=Sphingomonas donggukensis TaxID=2949093 RepID=A0ABY4TVF9_9SPHN|nr:serine hydrolase domain-containing protein [Sphingomonas donggukensis]URW76376.1 beta-lactamase family protein [Sphingomonas donggukensis]